MGGEDDEMGFKNGDETEVEITSMPLFAKVDPFFSSSDWDPVVSGLVSNNNFSTCHYPSLVMENPRINNGFAHYQTGSSSSYADMSTSLLPFGNMPSCNQIDKKCENEGRFMRSREVHEDHQISEDSVLGTSPCRKRRHLELETVPSSQWNKKAVEESRKNEQMEDQSQKKMESEGKMVDDSGGKTPMKKENNSQNGEATKENYIHVRARRGQATNSHSLAERVRREKISERMRLLQELVPGCNKITGKAVMLDEIINYVQSLQQQVEFLSMKLATVNPSLNIDIDRILAKDILHSRDRNIPILGLSNGMNLLHPYGVVQSTIPNIPTTNQQFNPSSQTVLDSELQSLYQMGYVSNSSNIDNFPSNGRLKPEL